jgi:hypothetical protein
MQLKITDLHLYPKVSNRYDWHDPIIFTAQQRRRLLNTLPCDQRAAIKSPGTAANPELGTAPFFSHGSRTGPF